MKTPNHLLSVILLVSAIVATSCTDKGLEDTACPDSDLAVSIDIQSNGDLHAVGSGGLEPYTFVWSDNSRDQVLANPSQEEYTVEIKDAAGCVRSDKIVLSAEGAPDGTTVGTVQDMDNNTYQTVKIGTQVWTQQNLNVSRYRNGDPIPEVRNPDEWINLRTGAWCYYENNTDNGPRVGKLYNWYAVTDPRGLAPAGYHVPTLDEWRVLIDHLGGTAIEVDELLSTGTNESGFTALFGGLRHTQDVPSAQFIDGQTWAWFWTSTDAYEDAPISVWGKGVGLRQARRIQNGGFFPKTAGMSIRLVKD